MMPKRRTILRLCLFLLLGAAVNVAVAWGFALNVIYMNETHMRTGRRATLDGAWHYASWNPPGSVIITSTWSVNGQGDWLDEDTSPAEVFPSWAPWHPRPQRLDVDPDYREHLVMEGRGWPLIALHCHTMSYRDSFEASKNMEIVCGGIELTFWPWRDDLGERAVARVLPYRPLWWRFMLNSIFYSVVLWGGRLLFAASFALRRRRRIKRGLCPACAYPVDTSDLCTECGSRLRSES